MFSFFKKMHPRRVVLVLGFILFGMSVSFAEAAPVKIVTTQKFYAEIVREIGKEKVEVRSIASPKFNVHFIQPKPSDVRNVAHADLVVYTGMDLEGWWGPLLEAAGRPEFFPGREKSVDMSKGIRILEVPSHPLSRAEGDIHLFGNPHFSMNPENSLIMARTVLGKLREIDPQNTAFYEANEKDFSARLKAKIAQWKILCAPCADKEIISYHEDIAYFADFLGMRAEQFLESKPGIPPTPKHLQFLESYIREKGIKVLVMPTYYSEDSAKALSSKIGGQVVTICQNVGETEEAQDLFSFFDYNFQKISRAFSGSH